MEKEIGIFFVFFLLYLIIGWIIGGKYDDLYWPHIFLCIIINFLWPLFIVYLIVKIIINLILKKCFFKKAT